MRLVKKLSPRVASLIAAGEVVESPLSVIKELVENSVDAEARKVKVKVIRGGLDLIEVTDDGVGIPFEDLPLVVERYTTSKISTPEDLLRISSYGFRGEALYAIAQVSTLEIISKYRDDEVGGRLLVKNGEVLEHARARISRGTIVKVRDLFASYPARRKAIKERREEANIRDFLKRLATITDVGISLRIGDKLVFSTYPDEPIPVRMRKLWGWRQKEMLLITEEEFGLKLWGYLSTPPKLHKDSTKLIITVNKRLLSPQEILEAIKLAYQKIFPAGAGYPHGLLMIEVPPEELDVNVHPRKLEVRFLKPLMVRAFIMRTLERELPKFSQVVSLETSVKSLPSASHVRRERVSGSQLADKAQLADKRGKFISQGEPRESFRSRVSSDKRLITQRLSGLLQPMHHQSTAQGELLWGLEGDELVIALGGPFLCVIKPWEVILIDKHAAHEKLIFLELRDRVDNGLPSQRLFLPVEVELPPRLLELAEAEKEEMERYGFAYEIGESKLILKGVPSGMRGYAEPEVLERIIEAGPEERLYHIAANMACKEAIKGTDELSISELFKLWRDIKDRLEEVALCPHGRPAVIRMNKEILEKMFNRKVSD